MKSNLSANRETQIHYRGFFECVVIGLALSLSAVAAPRLDVPPYPADIDLSSVEKLYKSAAYHVEVREAGKGEFLPCFVFETRNDWVRRDYENPDPGRRMDVIIPADQLGSSKGTVRTASFTQFSFSEVAVEVRVRLLGTATAQSVIIRPLRHNIPAQISPEKKMISFTLSRPLKVSIEINDQVNPLFLFSDLPDNPDPPSSYTYYYAPGVHRIPGDNGTLTLKSEQSVYIAAGAIVEGRIVCDNGAKNIRITGRGILSRGEWPHMSTENAFCVPNITFGGNGVSKYTLEGITIVQGTAWNVVVTGNDNLFKNIKQVHFSGNSDGITFSGDRNRVEDCFIFNNDDALVYKYGKDSIVSGLVVFGGVWGRLLLFQEAKSNVSNLLITDVDVINKISGITMFYSERGQGGFMEVRDVTFRNIRFEQRDNSMPYKPSHFVQYDASNYSRIMNINFENITCDQQFPTEGWIYGSKEYPIKGITFKNLRMGGRQILTAEDSHIKFNSFVTDVKFLPADNTGIKLSVYNNSIKVYPNPVTDELIIEMGYTNDKSGFKILNSTGQIVFIGKMSEKTIVETSDFPPGVYLLMPEIVGSFEFKRFVKI